MGGIFAVSFLLFGAGSPMHSPELLQGEQVAAQP